MAGYNLKFGEILNHKPTESELWECFNYVFSDSCQKTNSYKFGLIKSILDNLFNARCDGEYYTISYQDLFTKFTMNYWNLVAKYKLRQNRPNKRNYVSKIERIINKYLVANNVLETVPFESFSPEMKEKIINEVSLACRKYVVGALYDDLRGIVYSFDSEAAIISIPVNVYEYLLRYKVILEKNNYYSWAKFLEATNSDNQIVRILDKLELATPRRNNLTIYRQILAQEFEINSCFYCGNKLNDKGVHVDHFIPWSFVKDDRMWNLVLACPQCNIKKKDNLPPKELIVKMENQNKIVRNAIDPIVRNDFCSYSDSLVSRIWNYAKMSGLKAIH